MLAQSWAPKGLSAAHLMAILCLLIRSVCAASNLSSSSSFASINRPSFDFSSIGNKLEFVGDFDAVSFYNYPGQQDLFISNTSSFNKSSNTLYYQDSQSNIYPIGAVSGQVTTIQPYKDSYVIVGDFDSISLSDSNGNSSSTTAINSPALYNTTSQKFTNLDPKGDISGDIRTVYADEDNNLIYFGGKLSYQKTYGLLLYNVTSQSLAKAPFKGFNRNSVVHAISKTGDNSLVFGGYFYELGVPQLQFTNQTYFLEHEKSLLSNSTNSDNSTEEIEIETEQVVSFKYATIQADNTASGSPDDIICPSNSDSWLTSENQLGAWLATLPFSVTPSKIRLYNSQKDDSGVKLFRLYTSPSNSIMNLTYIDPSTGDLSQCDAWCPMLSYLDLSDAYSNINDSSVTNTSFSNDGGVAASLSWSDTYQDFGFVNDIEVNFLNFHIVEFYGSQAGLDAIQMFTTEILTFANNTLNSGNCGDSGNKSYSESTGDGWELSATGHYMSNSIDDISNAASNDWGVTFYPNISYSGNYSINYITPGCQSDGTCDTRGTVDVTLYDEEGNELNNFSSAQSNQFEKIENIWSGHLNATSGRPKVQVKVSNTGGNSATIVADKIAVKILGLDDLVNSTNSTIGRRKTNHTVTFNTTDYKIPLNGLFEYSLKNFSSFPTDYDTYNFSSKSFENKFVGNSSINQFGPQSLSNNSIISSLAYVNKTLYVAGEFESKDDGSNFLGISTDGSTDNNNNLKVSKINDYNNGLNGVVNQIKYIDNKLFVVGEFNNTTSKSSLTSLSSSSNDDNNALTKVAVLSDNNKWVTLDSGVSNSNEISSINHVNIDDTDFYVLYDSDFEHLNIWDNLNKKWFSNDDFNSTGLFVNVTSAGKANSNSSLIAGHLSVLGLVSNNVVSLNQHNKFSKSPVTFNSSTSNDINNILYVNDSFTVIAGNFTTKANQTNLVINNNGKISSFDDKISWGNSSVNSLSKDVNSRYLFVGLNGLATYDNNQKSNIIIYDMVYNNFTIPGAITKNSSAENAKINSFFFYQKDHKVFVAGDFDTASSMSCTSFCFYDMSAGRWNNDASNGFTDAVVNYMNETNSELFMTGYFAIDNAKGYFATYDFSSQEFLIDNKLYDLSNSNSKRDIELQTNSNGKASTDQTGISGEVKKYILVDATADKGRILALGDHFVSGYNKSAWVRLDRLNNELNTSSTFDKFQLINIKSNNISSKDENKSFFNSNEQTLLVVGNIVFNNYDNLGISAAIFNGTNWLPYIYTSNSQNSSNNKISDFIVNKAISVDSVEQNSVKHVKMDRGWIVFIGLALAVGTMMLLVLFALLILFWKRKNDSYDENQRIEEDQMVQTVPPDQLLNEMDEFKFTNEKAH